MALKYIFLNDAPAKLIVVVLYIVTGSIMNVSTVLAIALFSFYSVFVGSYRILFLKYSPLTNIQR